MSSKLPPTSPEQSILPDSGPYQIFRWQQASGFMLQAVCIQKPGIVRYLRERGLNLVVPLNIANCEISPQMIALRNDASPYVQALKSINDKEASGELPEGSVAEATSALFSGEFEDSTWYQYVIPPHPASP